MSGVGPIIIFDKSTLQSLSVDEALWLHCFYLTNITPLFFVETLADLEKEMKHGRKPEDVVGNLALKAAPLGARSNAHHLALCLAELAGARIEMDGRPVVGCSPVVTADGSGLLFRPSPEEEALERWRRSEFLEIERRFAHAWRNGLVNLDLTRSKRSVGGLPRLRNLGDARDLAIRMVDRDGSRYRTIGLALDVFDVPLAARRDVIARWKSLGGPSFSAFAPYSAHVLTVEVFLALALEAGLISADRPSNRVDIAYLYYLPFCMVFASSDNLHKKTAPLFLRPDQVFVNGPDLKEDLARLDAHYSALPGEVKKQGVLRFAQAPPTEGGFLTTKLWDQFMAPVWRENAARQGVSISKDTQDALLELVNKYSEEARSGGRPDLETANAVVFESRVPRRMGKWTLVPPEVGGKASRKEEKHKT
jgi:hypothetical protein